MKPLRYKDNAGNIGEGQTLTDLAQNTVAINKLRNTMFIIALMFWLLLCFILYQIMKWDLYTRLLEVL